MKTAVLLIVLATNAACQDAKIVRVVSKEPVYPQMARIAHIQGRVTVELTLQPDGDVVIEKATGHPILVQAAKESLQQSIFSCEGCGDQPHTFSLNFDFEITDDAAPIIPPAPASARLPHRVRSIRCVYLWKCGTA
jgi:TonB family protein